MNDGRFLWDPGDFKFSFQVIGLEHFFYKAAPVLFCYPSDSEFKIMMFMSVMKQNIDIFDASQSNI